MDLQWRPEAPDCRSLALTGCSHPLIACNWHSLRRQRRFLKRHCSSTECPQPLLKHQWPFLGCRCELIGRSCVAKRIRGSPLCDFAFGREIFPFATRSLAQAKARKSQEGYRIRRLTEIYADFKKRSQKCWEAEAAEEIISRLPSFVFSRSPACFLSFRRARCGVSRVRRGDARLRLQGRRGGVRLLAGA